MDDKPHIAGLVLAGGRSRRMGRDKAAALLGDRPLIAHVVARLAPQVGALAISANGDLARFAYLGLPVLADIVPGHAGPLAGILTGLRWADAMGARRLVIAPADGPFLPSDLVARLAVPGAPLAVAASAGRIHPVFALWDVALAEPLAGLLAAGERRVMAAVTALGGVTVHWPDDRLDPFANVNTPDDLARLQAQAGPEFEVSA